jgi:hypothetical protein
MEWRRAEIAGSSPATALFSVSRNLRTLSSLRRLFTLSNLITSLTGLHFGIADLRVLAVHLEMQRPVDSVEVSRCAAWTAGWPCPRTGGYALPAGVGYATGIATGVLLAFLTA